MVSHDLYIAGCLPRDVVLEILFRLPTRSLLKFSCVAKSWNSLILTNHFSKKHLQYLNKFEYRIMLSTGRKLEHFSLRSALNKFDVPVYDTNHVDKIRIGARLFYFAPIEDDEGYIVERYVEEPPFTTLIGSCNGLICIAVGTNDCICGNDIVYLWNPSIQKSKKIPSFGDEPGYKFIRSYGFGYDESCDDYKVVAFYFSCMDEYDVHVRVYSLKTGKVKRIKNHTGCWLVNRLDKGRGNDTTFANGKIHWFVYKSEEYFIAYLDLATEKYGKIKMPDIVNFCIGCDSMMALPGGFLYVYCHTISSKSNGDLIALLVKPSYEFWQATWTEVIISIPIYSDLFSGFRNPLFMLDNGTTVWRSAQNLFIFDPNDSSVRISRLITTDPSHVGIYYIESLVSPIDDAD